jgi:hypothetical protein
VSIVYINTVENSGVEAANKKFVHSKFRGHFFDPLSARWQNATEDYMELNELYYINEILMGFMNEETNLAAGNPQLHVIKDPEDNDGDNDNDTASSSCSSLLITRIFIVVLCLGENVLLLTMNR